MNITVPGPVATYLAADKAKDTELLDQCFREGAVVRDEGREHRGIAAIKAWTREADTKYRYVLEPLEASVSGPTVVVRARVTAATSPEARSSGGSLSPSPTTGSYRWR